MARVHMNDAFAGLDVDFTVKLWKHNKTAEEYDIPAAALMAGFRSFAEGYGGDKAEYFGYERMLVEYLTTHEASGGLESAVAWPWRTKADRKHEGGADSLTTGQWDELCQAARRIVWPEELHRAN